MLVMVFVFFCKQKTAYEMRISDWFRRVLFRSPNALERAVDLTAPLVFVGYGIDDDTVGIDDYKGLDVGGKIVVALAGYPDGIASEVGAHLNSSKTETAEAHGAIGFLTLPTIARMKIRPWERMRH